MKSLHYVEDNKKLLYLWGIESTVKKLELLPIIYMEVFSATVSPINNMYERYALVVYVTIINDLKYCSLSRYGYN